MLVFHLYSWFFGAVTRKHAENLLMQPFNECGSFLIRNSQSRPGDFALSILFTDGVRHYRIKKNNKSYSISNQIPPFESIPELVACYREKPHDLCVKLRKACFITAPPSVSSPEEAIGTCKVDRNSIQFGEKLGAGQFSEVWQGVWDGPDGTTEVAVRILKPGIISAHEFLQEAALMKQLRHPKLIQLYAVCTKEEPIYIITELMKHGSLLEYLRGDGHSVKLPQLLDMGAQVATGMAFLEEKNYVHQDLAARNVLVSENLICKVEVISMVRIISEDIYEGHTGFPIKWTAPEAVLYNRFTIKSDVWSFGILLYEMITYGLFPYPGMNNSEIVQELVKGYRMSCPKDCPEQLYKIMRECWRDDASSRPTFESLRWRMEDYFMENEPTHWHLDQIR